MADAKHPIYLDYAATTPVAPIVATAMMDCLTIDGVFANPASRSHRYGWQAEQKVELARVAVAELIAADPREIIFTSGATESNNLAIKGVFAKAEQASALITSTIEHKAVIDPAKFVAQQGHHVNWVKPDTEGRIALADVVQAITDQTVMVSLMWVNNEVGSINPIAEVGKLCRERDILFHVDAVQAAGKMPIDVQAMNIDLLSLSAHKFYGPKGIGALYVRRDVHHRLVPQVLGGGHERGLRSGTLPTHQIAGMGAAAELVKQDLSNNMPVKIAALRDRLWAGIVGLPGVKRNASETVACGHLNLCFSQVDGETLMLALRHIAVATGSACTSASVDPSYVLTEMGLTASEAHSSIRFSLGRYTTVEEIDEAIAHIVNVHQQLLKAAS